jgi:hypothetical protein
LAWAGAAVEQLLLINSSSNTDAAEPCRTLACICREGDFDGKSARLCTQREYRAQLAPAGPVLRSARATLPQVAAGEGSTDDVDRSGFDKVSKAAQVRVCIDKVTPRPVVRAKSLHQVDTTLHERTSALTIVVTVQQSGVSQQVPKGLDNLRPLPWVSTQVTATPNNTVLCGSKSFLELTTALRPQQQQEPTC